jgi:hypothetical protein
MALHNILMGFLIFLIIACVASIVLLVVSWDNPDETIVKTAIGVSISTLVVIASYFTYTVYGLNLYSDYLKNL